MVQVVKAVGALLTVFGLLLFAYAILVGLARGSIGSSKVWTPDSLAVIAGWFMLLVGPALYYGRKPARVVAG